MIPLEPITMLGSALLGGVMKMWGMKLQAENDRTNNLINKLAASDKSVEAARNHPSFTKRTIALTAVFSIVLLPKLMAAWAVTHGLDWKVTLGWTEFHPGWLFIPGKSVLTWHTVHGFALTPMDTNLMSAITGLYFGTSIVGHRR